jgi:hypothetical protein
MRKIWAVSSGSYSDYGVHAMFETEELAKAVAGYDNYYDVEEFILYDEVPAKVPRYTVYVAQTKSLQSWGMDRDADTVAIEGGWHILERNRQEWPWDWDPPTKRPQFRGTSVHDNYRGRWTFFYEGRDGGQCRKAAYDKIRELDERARLLDMQEKTRG